jgi:hypothetical protein
MDWNTVMKMLQGERENYYISKELHHRVVGQEEASKPSVTRYASRTAGHEKTCGNIPFPWNWELEKPNWQSLAEYLFDDENA